MKIFTMLLAGLLVVVTIIAASSKKLFYGNICPGYKDAVILMKSNNFSEAIDILIKCAELGDINSLEELININALGLGTKTDTLMAAYWIGRSDALKKVTHTFKYRLAIIYSRAGFSFEKVAFYFLISAALDGDKEAINTLSNNKTLVANGFSRTNETTSCVEECAIASHNWTKSISHNNINALNCLSDLRGHHY